MKKQLLFVVMLMCAISAFAVKLPSDPYSSYKGSMANTESYRTGTGTSFMNSAVTAGYAGECGEETDYAGDTPACTNCCDMYYPEGDASEANQEARRECYLACGVPLGDSPLDAPTAFLLALVAAYGAVAVYRRRKVQEA